MHIKAYLLSIIAKGCAVIGGLLTAELISRSLSPFEQGNYYAFLSLLGFHMVFDGLSTLLVVKTSHLSQSFPLEKNNYNGMLSLELNGLFQKASKWCNWQSIVVSIILFFVGWFFFLKQDQFLLKPWIAACSMSCFIAMAQPYLALLEGCGKVEEVAKIRLFQSFAIHFFTAISLLTGAGIFVIACGIGGAVLVTYFFLYRWKSFFIAILTSRGEYKWFQEIWSTQWRYIFVGMAIFTIGAAPVLFVKHYAGEAAAGEFGLARRMFELVLFVGAAMFTTRAAFLGTAFAGGRGELLRTMWLKSAIAGVCVSIFGSAAALCSLKLFVWLGFSFPERLGDMRVLFVLALLTVFNCANWSAEVFVRSNGSQPYLIQSIFRTIFTILCLWLVVPHYGSFGASVVLLILAASLVLPWNLVLCRNFWITSVKTTVN